MSTVDTIKPVDNFNYYAGDVYWNNFNLVLARNNLLISGNKNTDWKQYLRSRYGKCENGLFVNCGNGWVDRDFFSQGLISKAVGTDISAPLLDLARQAASDIGMPCSYSIVDANAGLFDTLDYDWVINHAAFHHIAYIDRAIRSIARGMKPDGLLIGFDYTGPHRNQYPWQDWERVLQLRDELPPEFQQDVRYPHLPTMLATDPSEAVHSELILDVIGRYFDFIELRPLGGVVAYELLFKNQKLYEMQDTPEGNHWVQYILNKDWEYTGNDPKKSYFNFWVATPRPGAFLYEEALAEWTREEDAREALAAAQGGRYGRRSGLETVYNEIADLRDEVQRLKANP